MQVSVHNTVKTYNLTAGKSLPEWLSERRKNKRLAGDDNRVELLHDLEFTHSAHTVFRCANGTNLFAAGEYPYRLKCFDVNNLSMKYSFNADMNILSGVSLSPDYRKFALRGEGRQITVHHSAAIVDRLRVPHLQRSLSFDKFRAELLSSGVSHEVFRINLETGAFEESYKTASTSGVNSVEVFPRGPVSGLVLTGGCDGALEAWDSRSGTCAARVQVAAADGLSGATSPCEIRHVAVEESGGMLFSCGLENGEVKLYDVRLQKPLVVKDHMNGLPIVKTYFFQGKSTATGEATHVLSADTRSLKVWNKHDGANFTSIETPADITDFCLFRSQYNMVPPYECDDSGVVAICCDVPRVQVHFIPQLGVAPRWAPFLDAMTEELEEKDTTTVYDDYTFIPKEEMDAIGITADDLAGGKVRPVMHGAFVENRLYRELKAVVNPAAFNAYLAENARKKRDARWSERISRFKRVEPEESELPAQAADGHGASALAVAKTDPRFSKAFDASTGKATSAFALDRRNPEYAKLLQTVEERRAKATARRERYEAELFSVVPDRDHAVDGEAADAPADDEADVRRQLRGVQSSGKVTRQRQSPVSARDKAGPQVTMYEARGSHSNIFTQDDKQMHAARKKARAEKLTLEERLARQGKS